MAIIPRTFTQSGRYYFRRRARLTKSLIIVITLPLRTREPSLAAHRAGVLSARFWEIERRVRMFIRHDDILTHAMAKEIFDKELRACLDDLLLGYFADPYPDSVANAYRTAAAAYRIARRPEANLDLTEDQRTRLQQQGFDEMEVEFVAADLDRVAHPKNLSRYDIEEWIAGFGMPPSRASYGAVASHMVRAHGRAHELASRYLDPEIQEAVDPREALLARAYDDSFQPAGMQHTAAPAHAIERQSDVAPINLAPPAMQSQPPAHRHQFFLTHSPKRFSEVIDEVVASLKADGRWTGDVSQQLRIMRSFAWITGDKPLGDYTHLDVSAFKSALQLLPVDFKFKQNFDKPYEAAAEAVRAQKDAWERAKAKASATGKPVSPNVKPYEPRQPATINRDLSYMSSVADYLAQSYWAPVVPNTKVLDFTRVLVKNAKSTGKTPVRPPWRVEHLRQLFEAPVWTGGRGHLQRLYEAPSEDVWHDAGYWLPILLYYTHATVNEIAGLKLDEISLDTPMQFLTVRNNNLRGTDDELRGEKRAARGRDIPLHGEIIRLGFGDYVEAIRAEGHSALFPELYLTEKKRGGHQFRATAWIHLMEWAEQRMDLPKGLRGKGVDMHSIRKTGSGHYAVAGVPDVVRADIMGHARTGTNGLHYSFRELSEEPFVAMKEALDLMTARITNVTSHLVAQPVRLLPLNHRSRFGAPPKERSTSEHPRKRR